MLYWEPRDCRTLLHWITPPCAPIGSICTVMAQTSTYDHGGVTSLVFGMLMGNFCSGKHHAPYCHESVTQIFLSCMWRVAFRNLRVSAENSALMFVNGWNDRELHLILTLTTSVSEKSDHVVIQTWIPQRLNSICLTCLIIFSGSCYLRFAFYRRVVKITIKGLKDGKKMMSYNVSWFIGSRFQMF